MLEKDFKVKVQKWLKSLPNVWSVKIQQRSISGTPDILACINGRFVAFELKKDHKSKITRLQEHNIKLIRDANGYAVVLHPENFEEIKTDIERNLS
jgi:hypothetical protein